jgi:hypothetical protein
MTRRRRRLVAWFGILGIAFAQFAVTAQACLTGAPVHATAARAVATGHEAHCDRTQRPVQKAPIAPVANACEVQCTDGAPSATAPDLPPVMLAVLPVTPVPVVLPFAGAAGDTAFLASTRAQPPPHLQFARLLI